MWPISPEDADQAVAAFAGAEVELRFGRDLDVVADPHLGPELLLQRLGEPEGPFPAGQVAGGADGPGLLVDVAGRAHADPFEVGRLDAGRLRGLDHRLRHRRGDVGGTAFRRRRLAGFALHRAVGVDHRGLDLGAAEIDAAA
jgi:hypothetical protein